jgi:hypothetical protein
LIASMSNTVIEPATPMSSQVTACPRVVVARHDPPEAGAQVLQVGCQREHGHRPRMRR